MTRHPHDLRVSSPAVQRARERAEARQHATIESGELDIKLEEIDAEGGVDVKEAIPQAVMGELMNDGKEPHWSASGDARVDLHLEREASFVRVTGTTSFALAHPCVRCLNVIPFDIDMKVDLRLVERTHSGPIEADYSEGDGDGDDFAGNPLGDAADLEDLDVASYADGVVRLGELLREQLFLDLPMHPACDSPRARPAQPCAFDAKKGAAETQGWTDPRWAGLASLRDKLPPGPETAPSKANSKPPAPRSTQGLAKKVEQSAPAYEAIPLPGRDSAPIPLPGPSTPAPKPSPKPAAPAAATPAPAAKTTKAGRTKKAAPKKAKKAATKKAKKAATKKAKKPAPKKAKKPAPKAKKAAPKKAKKAASKKARR